MGKEAITVKSMKQQTTETQRELRKETKRRITAKKQTKVVLQSNIGEKGKENNYTHL